MDQWPGAVGICCQCFEPIMEDELYLHREKGRKFHRCCFARGGYYVDLEKRLVALELNKERSK